MNKIKYLILAGTLALMAPAVHAQIAAANATVLVTNTNVWPGAATTSATTQAFYVNPKTGFAIIPNYQLTTGGTGQVTFNFAPSLTGTDPATSGTLSYGITTTVPLAASGLAITGTGVVQDYINVPALTSGSGPANAPWWYLKSITVSGTSSLTVNSITIVEANQ
ncbi:MAG: hypothetical protein ABSE62_00480 [Chthoniobacteraceae bacterium]|jgi:hypothetical protein